MPALLHFEEKEHLKDLIKLGDSDGIRAFLCEKNPWLGFPGSDEGTIQGAILRAVRNRDEVLELLVEYGLNVSMQNLDASAVSIVRRVLAGGPTWRRDAFEEGIREIYIVRSKAWGIYFVPGDRQCPFLYGGDYDGEYPTTAVHALQMLDRDLADERLGSIAEKARWFRPFIVKIVEGVDFPLTDVLSRIPDKRSIRFLQ